MADYLSKDLCSVFCIYVGGELQESDMLSLVRYIRSLHPDEEQEIVKIMGEDEYVLNRRNPFPQTATIIRPTAEIVCSLLVQSNLFTHLSGCCQCLPSY